MSFTPPPGRAGSGGTRGPGRAADRGGGAPTDGGAPTATLREEHRLILEVLGVLERLLDAEAPDPGPLDDCVAFFRLFTDACHHGKEEEVLFPALVGGGMPREAGPIAVMLEEHQAGRALVARMGRALERLGGGEEAGDELRDAGRRYIELLREHIRKEDGVLFEMADGAIPRPACRRLCEAYHEACARRLGGSTREELEALAARLVREHRPA